MRHLDEAVGGMALGEVCDGEGLGVRELFDLHGEEGDGALLVAVVCDIDGAGVGLNRDWGDGWREEIEEVAQRDSKGETVPELGDGVCGLSRGVWGGR